MFCECTLLWHFIDSIKVLIRYDLWNISLVIHDFYILVIASIWIPVDRWNHGEYSCFSFEENNLTDEFDGLRKHV